MGDFLKKISLNLGKETTYKDTVGNVLKPLKSMKSKLQQLPY